MIVVLKHNVPEEKRNQLINWLRSQRIDVHPSLGEYQTVLGLVGDTSRIDMSLLESLDIVDSVKRVSDPFKCCNRKFHPDDTVVSVGDAKFGGGHFAMIAGPCSVESEEQIVYVAKAVKAAGAQLLRGGAFKPRTSPYDFQGLHGEGIRLRILHCLFYCGALFLFLLRQKQLDLLLHTLELLFFGIRERCVILQRKRTRIPDHSKLLI